MDKAAAEKILWIPVGFSSSTSLYPPYDTRHNSMDLYGKDDNEAGGQASLAATVFTSQAADSGEAVFPAVAGEVAGVQGFDTTTCAMLRRIGAA
jgi:hypothetical protein